MGRKVSKGDAVDVVVPINTVVTAGNFHMLDGFLGMAMRSITTNGTTTGMVALDITLDVFESTQLDPGAAFTKSQDVYWDTANSRFTAVAKGAAAPAGGNFFGRVTQAKNANGAAWIKRCTQAT